MQLWKLTLCAITAGTASAAPLESRAAPVDQLVGYAAGTTGGGSASPVTVTSCSQLSSALSKGGVIKIQGKLSGCGTLLVPSDTTILGVGRGSGLDKGGLRLKKVNNVIIRNLDITPPSKADAIDLETSTKVWVDHCDLHSVGLTGGKDDYDGLFDAKRGSDFITVSWTKFHDHVRSSSHPFPFPANSLLFPFGTPTNPAPQWKGSLIGHSDSSTDDKGKLRITYHHNSFINVNSRLPSLRFGSGHIYSNCYQNCPTSGVNSRMGAKVLVEENAFNNVPKAIVTNLDSDQDGYAVERNNIFTGTSTKQITQSGAPSIGYAYT